MRIYLTPMVGNGAIDNPNRGKYIQVNFKGKLFPGIIKGATSIMQCGAHKVCLMSCYPTDEEHAELMKNGDVYAFPIDLDRHITDASTINSALLIFGLPHDWVRNGMRYREALRRLSGMFQMMQNMNGQQIYFRHLDSPFGMETRAGHFKHGAMMGTLRETLEKVGEEYQETKFLMKAEV